MPPSYSQADNPPGESVQPTGIAPPFSNPSVNIVLRNKSCEMMVESGNVTVLLPLFITVLLRVQFQALFRIAGTPRAVVMASNASGAKTSTSPMAQDLVA